MSDPQSTPEVAKNLTEQEKAELYDYIKKTEVALYLAVLGRLKTHLLLVTGFLTLFGILSFTSLKQALVDEAANTLAGNERVRSDVVDRSAEFITEVTGLRARADSLSTLLEREEGRAMLTLDGQLGDIRRMMGQIQNEIDSLGIHSR